MLLYCVIDLREVFLQQLASDCLDAVLNDEQQTALDRLRKLLQKVSRRVLHRRRLVFVRFE
jgi:hypothetical protein